MTFQEFTQAFPGISTNYLTYHGLLHAIPTNWKNSINTHLSLVATNHTPIIEPTKSKFKLIMDAPKVCNFYIKELRKNMTHFPVIPFSKWTNNLNSSMDQNEYLSLFENMYSTTKDSNLLAFNYKLLHRNIITNRNLNLWDSHRNENERHTDSCTFCSNDIETIEHIFIECPVISKLWEDLFSWLQTATDTLIIFTKEGMNYIVIDKGLN